MIPQRAKQDSKADKHSSARTAHEDCTTKAGTLNVTSTKEALLRANVGAKPGPRQKVDIYLPTFIEIV